jgi:beta-aspartyl-peptidase (threonine type)
MPRLRLVAFVVSLSAGALLGGVGWYWPYHPAPGQSTVSAASPDDDRVAIRKLLDDQVAEWNRGDLKAFMSGYWNSEKLTFYSGKTRTHGYKATLERYQKRYQAEGKEMGKLRFELFAIDLVGPDAAVVRGKFELTMKKEKPNGLFTLLLRRLPEGWRVVHDHTSS